ncbi:cnot9 [Symbiodinium sp. KB8]|nr:cnot9 [Symbiodinium sp. KB8]
MAHKMAKQFGSEMDRCCTFLQRVALRLARRVNCPFYLKIGACRHGARCSRKHIAPRMSTTVMFRQLYNNPKGHVMAAGDNPDRVKDEDVLESVRVLGCLLDFRVARVGPPPQFLDFTEDIFMEASEFGEVDDFMVFDNLADHLIGHVYIKFFREEDAQACLENLNGRWYGGRVVQGELTNASDFKAATCRQFFTGQCRFGFNCNFGHPKAIPKDFFEELQKEAPSYGKNERFAPATLGFAHDGAGTMIAGAGMMTGVTSVGVDTTTGVTSAEAGMMTGATSVGAGTGTTTGVTSATVPARRPGTGMAAGGMTGMAGAPAGPPTAEAAAGTGTSGGMEMTAEAWIAVARGPAGAMTGGKTGKTLEQCLPAPAAGGLLSDATLRVDANAATLQNPHSPYMAAAASSDKQEEAEVAALVKQLLEPSSRATALLKLSKKRESIPYLAPLLWHSFGSVAVLLQEVVAIYPALQPPTLTRVASNRVCNALALLQSVASHQETRQKFLAGGLVHAETPAQRCGPRPPAFPTAHIPLYLYPFLNTLNQEKPFEYLRLTSLGVIGALVKQDDKDVVSFLLQTEIIPLCLRIMESGSDLSKTVATFIVQKILLDDAGLKYICATGERFYAVNTVLHHMIEALVKAPSNRLLKQVVRCFDCLAEHEKARQALRQTLHPKLRDGHFLASASNDANLKEWLTKLTKL